MISDTQKEPLKFTTKKSILEAIEATRQKAKMQQLSEAEVQTIYHQIDESIKTLNIKVNTMVYLKDKLRTDLGKYISQKEEDNAFVRFYKQTFQNQVKTKVYTYSLIDLSRLKIEAVLATLKTVNTYGLKHKLTDKEKADIMPMIERVVDTQKVHLINQLRSMEGIRKNFKIRIVENDKRFEIKFF